MTRRLPIVLAAIAPALIGLQTQITSAAPIHDLVVMQVGDGSDAGGTLATGTAAVVLRDYDITFGVNNIPTATLMQSIPVSKTPSVSGDRALTIQDSATAEGGLNVSADGQYFVFGGYNSAVDGTASTGTTERVIGRLDLAGNVDTTTAIPTGAAFGGTSSAMRSVATDNGSQYWIGSGSTGIRYATHAAATSTSVATPNVRRVDIYDGVTNFTPDQLYTSVQSTANPVGGMQGVGTVGSGLETDTGNTVTPLPGTPATLNNGNGSPYDFFFADAVTMYVTDDRTVANGGGIQKWIYDTGPDQRWELQFTLNATNYRGLTGVVIGSDVVLFATTAHVTAGGNQLVAFNDTLGNLAAGAVIQTLLDTATAGSQQFRGLDIIPIPEPTGLAFVAAGALALARRRRS